MLDMNKSITNKYQKMCKIQVGNMTIGTGMQKGRIWLQNEQGEGGDFSPEQIAKVLEEYFNKHL